MIIEITKEDIRLGRRSSINACPVARALRRRLGTEAVVSAYYYRQTAGSPVILISEKLAEFIHDFDHGLKVKPMRARVSTKP